MIQAYKSHTPKIAKTAYVHPSAVIIGDVTIGEYTNIWPGAVLRGDLQPIVVGDYTNIQDNVTVHVMSNAPTHIGSYVTIGHNAVIHCSNCGVGACLVCTCKTKSGNKRTCKDGPVFNGFDVEF